MNRFRLRCCRSCQNSTKISFFGGKKKVVQFGFDGDAKGREKATHHEKRQIETACKRQAPH